MRRRINHEFVEFIPDELKDGILYISMGYATAAHKCCCGCQAEVVTPLSPTDWKIIYDGQTVSLDPSIGNWSFKCNSHYWIRNGRVVTAPKWSREEIEVGRLMDRAIKKETLETMDEPNTDKLEIKKSGKRKSWLKHLLGML